MKLREHAVIRLSQRCNLTRDEVRSMLENDRYHPIGTDDKKQHQHLLLYSEKDNECFVFVQDSENKEVITILPINYHSAWIIHDDAIELAKKAYYGDRYVEPKIKPKEITKEMQKEIDIERSKNAVVKTITIMAHKATITKRFMAYRNITVTSRENPHSRKVCVLSDVDFINAGFPSNVAIEKQSVLKEYQENINFATNLNNLIQNALVRNSIDASDIYRYSMILKEKNKEFTIACLGTGTEKANEKETVQNFEV